MIPFLTGLQIYCLGVEGYRDQNMFIMYMLLIVLVLKKFISDMLVTIWLNCANVEGSEKNHSLRLGSCSSRNAYPRIRSPSLRNALNYEIFRLAPNERLGRVTKNRGLGIDPSPRQMGPNSARRLYFIRISWIERAYNVRKLLSRASNAINTLKSRPENFVDLCLKRCNPLYCSF